MTTTGSPTPLETLIAKAPNEIADARRHGVSICQKDGAPNGANHTCPPPVE